MDEVSAEVLTRSGRYRVVAPNVHVKEVVVGDGERRRRNLVCFNPQEAERQRRDRTTVVAQLEEALAAQRQGGRGIPSRPARCSRVPATGATCQSRRADFSAWTARASRPRAKLDGKWVVTSNDDTLSAEDLALGYKQLMRVEECWRTLKSGLRTRPIYHWRPHRIVAQVSLCVLALLLERVAETRGGDTWRNLAAQLETIKVAEYERHAARVRQTTEITTTVANLLQQMEISPPPKRHWVESTPTA